MPPTEIEDETEELDETDETEDEPDESAEDDAPADDESEAEPEAEADAEKVGKGDDEPPALHATLMARAKELGVPLDLSKYDSEEAAIKGLANMARMVGRTSEEAEQWRQLSRELQTQGRWEEFQEFLAGEAPAKPAKEVPADGDPKTYREFLHLQALVEKAYDAKGEIKPGTDPALIRKVESYREKMGEVLWGLVNDPASVFAPAIEPLKRQNEQAQAYAAANANNQAKLNVIQQNAKFLHHGGVIDKDTPTEAGEKVYARYQKMILPRSQGGLGAEDCAETLQDAVDYVKQLTPRPKATKQTSDHALHRPGVSAEGGKGKLVTAKEAFRTVEKGGKGWTLAQYQKYIEKHSRQK